MRRKTETDDEVKVVRGLKASHKLILAAAGIITALVLAINFLIDMRVERYIKQYDEKQKKIGRQEFTNYKEEVRKQWEKIDRQFEKADDRIRELERFHRNER